MSTLHDRSAQRAMREIEEQRAKNAQFLNMLDEVGSDSESDEEAIAFALPSRGGAGRSRGGRGVARAGAGGAGAGRSSAAPKRRQLSYGAAFRGTGAKIAEDDDDDDESSKVDREAVARAHRQFKAASASAFSAPAGHTEAAKMPETPDGKSYVNTKALKPLITRHARKGERVQQCYVIRNKSGRHMLHPLYTVYSEDGDRFLMAAKKRMANRTSNYLIAMSPNPTDRKSENVVGKLRANWTGSGYLVFDEGINPEKAVTDTAVRRELAMINFEYDKMGPGRMMVAVPRVTGGRATVFKPMEHTKGIEAAVERRDSDAIMFLANKRPKWDDSVGGHVLNFQGRVTMSSVKNFQLGCDELGDETVLQFGRVGKNKFTMDFQYPLSAVQAFAICLSSLDGKLADSKAFESMRDAASSAGKQLTEVRAKMQDAVKK